MKVKHLEITKDMSIEDFMKQLEESGVLGAGRIAHATNLLADSMKDEDTKIFLSLAGPMIPGGLRKVVRDLIYHGYVDLIISSGANLTHDLVESFGGRHYISTGQDDETLQDNGMGRIADIYTKSDDFEIFEEEIKKAKERGLIPLPFLHFHHPCFLQFGNNSLGCTHKYLSSSHIK